tara:strand:+ start:26 stop:451 length:426 start_codon:yes stop_codon:yes gene_type:complete
MFEELEKYKKTNHFFYSKNDDLKDVCNAPNNGIGVYLIYALKNGKIDLVYIGSSGKITNDGKVKVRIGGMCDRLINGKQFGGYRRNTWKDKLIADNIEALDVYWYETFDESNNDIPNYVEGVLFQRYFEIYGGLPQWNKEF